MALSANLLTVGQGGSVLWGTTGIAAPTSGTSSVASWNDFGYLDEDGVTVTVTPQIQEFNVWQSNQPGRRGLQNQTIAVSGKFAEINTNTVPRAFGGGTLANLTGGSFAFLSTGSGLEEFAVLVDATDGTDVHRFYFGRANQTEAVEVQFNRQNLAVLPFNFGVLAPSAGGSPGLYWPINA